MDLLTFVFAHGSVGLLPDHEGIMFLFPLLPAMLIGTIVVGAALSNRGSLGASDRTVAVGMPLAIIAAVLSLAAAGIHFAVISDHLQVDVAEALFFLALGWFQLIWAQAYLLRPGRALAQAAIAVNVVVIVIWVWSRTTGLPFGSQPGVPEALGLADLLASSFELGMIGLLLPTLLGTRYAPALNEQIPMQKAFVLVAFTTVAVGLLTAMALVPPAFNFLAFA